MGWYQVIKSIKGYRYAYLQRTWREGKHVRTESRYLGPVDSVGRSKDPPADAPRRMAFHGARTGITGVPHASDEGTFGPGFYLTTAVRARRYATLAGKVAAKPNRWDGPRFDGRVYAVEIGHLNLKVMTHVEFLNRSEALDEREAATPEAKAKLAKVLAAEGYDGLDIKDDDRPEIVIFPTSLHKIELKSVTTTITSERQQKKTSI